MMVVWTSLEMPGKQTEVVNYSLACVSIWNARCLKGSIHDVQYIASSWFSWNFTISARIWAVQKKTVWSLWDTRLGNWSNSCLGSSSNLDPQFLSEFKPWFNDLLVSRGPETCLLPGTGQRSLGLRMVGFQNTGGLLRSFPSKNTMANLENQKPW